MDIEAEIDRRMRLNRLRPEDEPAEQRRRYAREIELDEQRRLNMPDPEKERRTGAYVLQTAKALGWKDDGEGALEFMLRRAREVAFEDYEEEQRGEKPSDSAQSDGIHEKGAGK
jgi:hypothetical protein